MTGASSSPSPVTTSGPATPGPTKTTTKKPKPFNVFTNDGSFLERFQQSKKVFFYLSQVLRTGLMCFCLARKRKKSAAKRKILSTGQVSYGDSAYIGPYHSHQFFALPFYRKKDFESRFVCDFLLFFSLDCLVS
ncbi:hypothetical protein M378DRAFT_160276 [Amanita muscaria Koide BX008]|uniref:Uncharacterized protein n=1 Tax=Amanita muscaria (strain Koide BX008) TaxID=946122 RepID=A0A0C2WY83_AMAMK|nr:hypothetical protein M378DRAFT_160276 [Amanita muscaria Koide BX008]